MENSVFYTDVTDENVGNSQWYVVLEQPLPITQQAAGSPVPPPRQRHNPFNKPEVSPHQRSHSLRSAPGRMDESANTSSKISISFRELHNSYGRPILTDFNSWKHEQRILKEKMEENLIKLWISLVEIIFKQLS